MCDAWIRHAHFNRVWPNVLEYVSTASGAHHRCKKKDIQRMTRTLTATIWREDDGYVALCSELDIASQGDSIEEARSNLKEAVELFFDTAHLNEIAERLN